MNHFRRFFIVLLTLFLMITNAVVSARAEEIRGALVQSANIEEGSQVISTIETSLPFVKNAANLGAGFSEGFCPFINVGGKIGYINTGGRVVYAAQLESATNFIHGFAYVQKDGVFGYLDTSGQFTPGTNRINWVNSYYINYERMVDSDALLEAKYITFQDRESGLWGIADLRDNIIIPAEWEEEFLSFDDLMPVRKDGKYGYIDKSGKLVIDTLWDEAAPFSEGLAAVRKDGLYGYIDKQGEVVIKPQFEQATSFSFGEASVLLKREGNDEIWGAVNASGSINYHPLFDGFNRLTDHLFSVKKNGLYGVMDSQGNLLHKPVWKAIRPFSKGIALIEGEDGYGFINDKGELISKPQWDSDYYAYYNDIDWNEPYVEEELTYLYDGLIRVCKDDINGNVHKCGFVDKDGKVVIPPQELYSNNFSEGLSVVYHDGKYGYIDKTGKVVIPLVWDNAYSFQNGVALVMVHRAPREGEEPIYSNLNVVEAWGLIDRTGQILITPKWDSVPLLGDGVIIASEEALYNVYDYQGNMLSK